MDLQKLYPWNWFKHEESPAGTSLPVKRGELLASSRGQDPLSQHPLMQLQQQMDRLFDDAFAGFGLPALTRGWSNDSGLQQRAFCATVNVSSDAASYHISVEAPGLTEQDVSLELADGVLTISGEKQAETETRDRHYYRVERSYGSFRRVLALPEDSDVDAIRASMKNGVLELHIPRNSGPARDVKRIPISS